MVKQVRFWEWDTRFGYENIRLGAEIQTLLKQDLIEPGRMNDEFHLTDNPLIKLMAHEGVVNGIVFLNVRDVPFLPEENDDNDRAHSFEHFIDNILQPVPELNGSEVLPQNYNKTDLFLISYTDEEPSIAMILKKT